ncbi:MULTISPECIES: oxidoreductase [unclassified Arthrobacter]|jgi:NAD(P)-dependent dehydrogenase (short-subunit alcohol dehydrogenase family)|uniref:oxidoreductase n=1 Tax=unclassified Arthrobacter TaxID=235627 RepID=UPI00037F23D2|nr:MULTISPECIES: oxidoreductase [unclassified Arthrobacter]BCW54404.1 short-chain dehydrogenase/reductase [Arthrobacter sp. StoSoilB19]
MPSSSQVALVTGASTGIGRAVATALVTAGFNVVGTSRSAVSASPIQGVTFIDLDVTSDESVAAAVEKVLSRFGRIDVLVNNAGVGASGAAEDTSLDQDRRVFDINVFGVMRMTKAVLPHMRSRKTGRIINISSVVGFIPQPFMAVYSSSKHAVEGYTESLDHELREHGIRALLVEPAWTSTDFDANNLKADQPLADYATQRRVFEEYMASAVRDGYPSDVVADTVVTAARAARPKARYAAGARAGQVHLLRRYAPASVFDSQIRKLNHLPA